MERQGGFIYNANEVMGKYLDGTASAERPSKSSEEDACAVDRSCRT